jgi:hypothetical protein
MNTDRQWPVIKVTQDTMPQAWPQRSLVAGATTVDSSSSSISSSDLTSTLEPLPTEVLPLELLSSSLGVTAANCKLTLVLEKVESYSCNPTKPKASPMLKKSRDLLFLRFTESRDWSS